MESDVIKTKILSKTQSNRKRTLKMTSHSSIYIKLNTVEIN